MLIPASLSHTQQADASHIWPQYLRDLSVAPELRLTMSSVLGGPHSLNSCLKWLHVRFECVFLDWFETVKLSWKFLEVDCRIEGKDILFYLRFSMEVLALPARLWPEGSEIMSLTVGADRERWVSDSWASFPPCLLCFNTDVQPRTRHGNVTFAFRRYLHWSCVYLAPAAEKEARQQTHAGRSESIQISTRDTGPSLRGRARLSRTESLTTWVFIYGTASSLRQSSGPVCWESTWVSGSLSSSSSSVSNDWWLPPVTQLSVTCSDLLQRGCGDWNKEERANACGSHTNCFPDNRKYKAHNKVSVTSCRLI